MRLLQTTLVFSLLASVPAASYAGPVLIGTGEGTIEGKDVSGRMEMQIDDVTGDLLIRMTNTGTATDFAAAHIMTGIALRFDGSVSVDVSNSTVQVGPGSSLFNRGTVKTLSDPTDLSKEWGLAQDQSLIGDDGSDLGSFDFLVTATMFDDATEIFRDGEITPSSRKLNGGDFGLISGTSPDQAPFKNMHIVQDTVDIRLSKASGEWDLAGVRDVTFFFGSDTTGIVGVPDAIIPEPSSLALLGIGSLCCFAGGWRRRKQTGSKRSKA